MSAIKRPRLSSSYPSLLSVAQDRLNNEVYVCSWCVLPLELLVKIFTYLNPKDRREVGSVCTRWRTALNVPTLWEDSWIFLKPGLKSRHVSFWNLLEQRGYAKFGVQGRGCLSDLSILSDKLKRVTGITGLKVLISYQPDNRLDLKILHSFSSLQILHLDFVSHFTSFKWISSVDLASLTSLSELRLSGITDLCMLDSDFLSHPQVHTLVIRTCGSLRSRDTKRLIYQFPKLRKLSILSCFYYHCLVSDNYLSPIHAPLPPLTSLDLSRTVFGTIGHQFGTFFSNLRYINLLLCIQKYDNLIKILSPLPLLEEIHIRGVVSSLKPHPNNYCVLLLLCLVPASS